MSEEINVGEIPRDATGISTAALKKLSVDQKRLWLLQILANNLPGCDFMVCLLFGAINSNQVDQCIRPFPSLYIKNGTKDFMELVSVLLFIMTGW